MCRVGRSLRKEPSPTHDTLFLSGDRDGGIVSVQQVSIHGTIMVDVAFQLKNETVACTARIGPEAISGALAPGAAVVVTFLMNVVTSIRVTG